MKKVILDDDLRAIDVAGEHVAILADHRASVFANDHRSVVEIADALACRFTGLDDLDRQSFAGQEPGTSEEIQAFCETQFGVTFPLFEKVEVNGEGRHPLFAELAAVPDVEGYEGDVRWNFEKWLVSRDGEIAARFSPVVIPDDPQLSEAIERELATVPAQTPTT